MAVLSSRYARSQALALLALRKTLRRGVPHPSRRRRQPRPCLQVGRRHPALHRPRRAARTIEDADGHKYIDYVMSWGPLIHGHAPKGLLKALAARGGPRHELRRADRARDAAGAARRDADAVDGARALRQLRHRGGDERGAGRARGDQARQDRQVRRVLSRPRGLVPGAGGLGRDDARRADEPRRPRRGGRRHPARPLQRSRLGAPRRRSTIADRSPRSSSSRSPATWGWSRRAKDFSTGCARSAIARAILLVFDEVISGFRAATGGAQQIFGVRPDLTCLGKIIGGGLPVGAYGGRADIMALVAPAGPVYQAGTLSGNPLAMTAGSGSLEAALAAALPAPGEARRASSPPAWRTRRATPACRCRSTRSARC